MKRFCCVILTILVFFSCDDGPIISTFGSISGVVVDSKSSIPLSGVRVSLTPTGLSQVTGQDGAFLFDKLEVQEYTVVFVKDGYKSEQQKVSLKPGVTSPTHTSLTPLAGAFTATPSDLDFGSINTSMKVQLRNASGTATNYSASTSNGWLLVSPQTGSITQSDYLTVMVSREGLSPGDYNGEVTIRYAGETLIIPVAMSIMSSAAAIVSIESVTEVGSNSAKVKASILSVGSSSVTKMGVCWSSDNTKPTLSNDVSNQGGANASCSFSAILTGLTPETTYYCRAYAQNSAGVSYSEQCLSFTTTSPESGGGDNETVVVTQGLMLYITFDEDLVKDETDNEIETIAIGSPSFLIDTPSGTGKSLLLNGIKGQYISIPYALFDKLNNYSISFWAKDFSSGSFVSGISNYDISYSHLNRPKVFMNSDGKLIFDTFGRSVNSSSDPSTPPFNYPFTGIQSGQWHHICVTFEKLAFRNVSTCLYVDGTFVDTLSDDTCDLDTTKIIIGGDADGGYVVSMTTKIDNIRFYNRTLTKEEVKTISQSEKNAM